MLQSILENLDCKPSCSHLPDSVSSIQLHIHGLIKYFMDATWERLMRIPRFQNVENPLPSLRLCEIQAKSKGMSSLGPPLTNLPKAFEGLGSFARPLDGALGNPSFPRVSLVATVALSWLCWRAKCQGSTSNSRGRGSL